MTNNSKSTDTTTVEVSLQVDGRTLYVYELAGTEGFSEPFQFDLRISTSETALPIDSFVGKQATLTLESEGRTRTLHGAIASFEQGYTRSDEAQYRATLVPTTWSLSRRTDSRVFQKMDVKAVITAVLAAHGFSSSDYILPTTTFSTRDVVVQYRETDWDFISRLMEEEGIHYYFEHDDDACTLVMTDDGSVHRILPFESLEYAEDAGALGSTDERVTSFTYAHAATTEQVTTWSVSLTTPSTTATTTVNATTGTTSYDEVFDFQPKQSATNQLAALQVGAASVVGVAETVRMAPGGIFTLENHPRADFDTEYLVTRVVHERRVSRTSTYRATFHCIPATTSYRPAQKTPKPSIVGPQAATVVGRAGAEIDTDAYGRVHVRMHWDRNASTSYTSSVPASYELWVYVAQLAGGGGAMFLPRAGTHVLVEFIDGDPDKPVITGRFYSDQLTPPYVLPSNATKSTIRSKVYGKTDEYSELTFDDAADVKQVYLRAQRSLKVDVGTATETSVERTTQVYGDDALTITGQRSVAIGEGLAAEFAGTAHDVAVMGDESIAVSGDQTISVEGSRSLVVGASADEVTVDDATNAVTVVGSQVVNVSGWETVKIGTGRSTTVGPSSDGATYDASALIDVTTIRGSQNLTVLGSQVVSISTNQTVAVEGNKTETIQGNYSQTVYGTNSTILQAYDINSATTLKLTASGEICIESTDDATKIGGSTIYLSADSNIEIRSATSISLVIGSLTDSGDWSRKLVLDEDGVYVSNGKVKQRLTGSTVKFNC